jgi:hypothetical protein
MAIISIPTSIGGVSIPGAALKGPLGKLFGNGNQIEVLSYPRDLQSATRNHVVQFTINEVQPTGYQQGKSYTLSDAWNGVKNSTEELTGAATKGFAGDGLTDKTINAASALSSQAQITFKQKKSKIKAAINLYMPDTLEFTNSAGYNQTSLLEVAESVITKLPGGQKFAQPAFSAVQSNAAKLALSSQGLALNPQQQLLFDGIDFRSFQMSFTFTPFSKDEATAVKNIVKMFKTHAAPRIVSGSAGMLFVPPSTFNLKFISNGKENENIGKVAECVIETIDVNYAPNGWSAHTDGSPIQTTLSISFKEIELIDREKIEKDGY